MQPCSRKNSLSIAILLLAGVAISSPCLGGTIAGSESAAATMNAMGKRRSTTTPVVPVKPRILELKPMPAQRVARLSKEAREKYNLALKYLDKINYDKTSDLLQQAIQLQPDEVYLRFMQVQLAQYLGDTRNGPDSSNPDRNSIKYYDIAIENLQAMINSPALNTREKQRAQGALETIVSLRQSIGEREEKRRQAGFDIAKQYSKEIFQETDKREIERQQRSEQVSNYVQTMTNTSTRNPGNYGMQQGNYSMHGVTRLGR